MGTPAEARELVAHFLNVSYPYSYSSPKFALIGDGVEELNEEFEADEEDIQYIHEKTKTRNVKGYAVGFDIELKYIKDNELQIYANRMIRKPPTGLDTKGDYIRINKDEPMFGVSNAYIGVRRQATVYPESIGGSADDSLGSSIHVSGNTEPEAGYVTITVNSDNTISYDWTSAPLTVPIITSPERNSTISSSSATITGTGIAGATVSIYYGAENPVSTTVGDGGVWTTSISSNSLSQVADNNGQVTISAKQEKDGVSSVTCQPVTFTFTNVLRAPTITYPSTGQTGVALSTTIRGIGASGATVTVTDSTSSTDIIENEVVDSAGLWGKTVTLSANTTYKITATQTFNGSTSSASTEVEFTTVSE